MENTQDETSNHSCSSDIGDTFGDPDVIPRVGDEFQAEIPPLIEEFHALQLIKMTTNPESYSNNLVSCPFGLPIPLMWRKTGAESINGMLEFEHSEESQISSTNKHPDQLKVEPVNDLSGHKEFTGVESNAPEASGSNKTEGPFGSLPGSVGTPWTEVERDSFLLGLYIFGKNLICVKNFVESKEMGDILCFYYGEFYKSKQYCRWSESRKLKNKRSICGPRIFTGWRQQELLSRLFSRVSNESQSTLLEVGRKFSDGKISLEEYVSALKSTVGIEMLTEAVGIGRGNRDLTGMSMEQVKVNNSVSEIPLGKAWSSLESADIIKFLTGGFRLSKARSNDLFWEAVWPRLLARGWRSEEPKGSLVSGARTNLVFLIPGVKKFSRRKLVKGNHYFDSVTDVLNKVAAEPWLLELETKSPNGSQNEEANLSEKRGNGCLQNCNPNPNKKRGVHKFTIVDTSIAKGAKVRELRSLAIESTCASASSSGSSESDEDSSEGSQEAEIESVTLSRRESVDRSDGANSNHLSNSGDVSSSACSLAKDSLVDANGPSKGALPMAIDLNKPPMSPDFSGDENLVRDVEQNNGNVGVSGSSLVCESGAQQPQLFGVVDGGANRRVSKRNRPLTTKALEALEMGLLSTKKRKGGDFWWTGNSKCKSPEQVCTEGVDLNVVPETKNGDSLPG